MILIALIVGTTVEAIGLWAMFLTALAGPLATRSTGRADPRARLSGHYRFPRHAIDVAAELSDRIYEGPFDLLLDLILAEEVDIHEVNLARIVDAYLVEIERIQALDLIWPPSSC